MDLCTMAQKEENVSRLSLWRTSQSLNDYNYPSRESDLPCKEASARMNYIVVWSSLVYSIPTQLVTFVIRYTDYSPYVLVRSLCECRGVYHGDGISQRQRQRASASCRDRVYGSAKFAAFFHSTLRAHSFSKLSLCVLVYAVLLFLLSESFGCIAHWRIGRV